MSDGKKTYEAMFVLDGGGADFEAASEPVRKILDRNEAEVLALKPWDDRRLAYEIKGRRRGLYALAYFNADPSKVVEIEHDCQLAEQILRALFLARDHLTDEELAAETPMTSAARRASEASRAKAAASAAAAAEKEQEESKSKQDADLKKEASEAPMASSAEEPAQAEETTQTKEPTSGKEPAQAEEEGEETAQEKT